MCGICDFYVVAGVSAGEEANDPVLSGIFPCHKGGPRGRRQNGDCGNQLTISAIFYHSLKKG